MFWKLVLGSMLLAAIVDCERYRCKRATEKMDDCLKNGYKFRDCAVETGQLTTEQTEKCEWLAEKIERQCPDYKCESGSPESESTESGEYVTRHAREKISFFLYFLFLIQ